MKDIKLQLKMASTMKKRGIEMWVFVAHKIYWDKPVLTSGNQNSRDEFLDDIKKSIEVAKRVDAKWMISGKKIKNKYLFMSI